MRDLFELLLVALARVFGRSAFPGWCNICDRFTVFTVHHYNLREDASCVSCRSFNRKRQVMHVLRSVLRSHPSGGRGARVWNTEASGSLHRKLGRVFGEGYVGSEYLGEGRRSGEIVGGTRHEDLCGTSFAEGSLDIVVSCDVLEHVPGPERAFSEVSRILKPGGCLLFTTPYVEGMSVTEYHVRLSSDGEIEHLREPTDHGDPKRGRGSLVCQVFGDDIFDMCGGAGLECRKARLRSVARGILGRDGIVFVARKP
jgi:hypothetical protein